MRDFTDSERKGLMVILQRLSEAADDASFDMLCMSTEVCTKSLVEVLDMCGDFAKKVSEVVTA